MWVNRRLFDLILADNKTQSEALLRWQNTCHLLQAKYDTVSIQKTKDDLHIDWLRNRVNALEKERTILWQRASGIALPTPEIEISKPRTVQQPDFNYLPSFEDIGDDHAKELGIAHDTDGQLVYTK